MAARSRTTRGATKETTSATTESTKGAERPHVCSVAFCPIGLALTGVQGAGTDALEHLLAAAREFLLAAKAVVDARAADLQSASGDGLQKIEIA